MGSSPNQWFCACKTAALGQELQVSVVPDPTCSFFHAKQRLLDKNSKSLWDPDMTCHFVHAKHRD